MELSDIVATRNQGVVRWLYRASLGPDVTTGSSPDRPSPGIRSMLLGAELLDVADDLVEIDEEQAGTVLRASLELDLAYNAEVLPAPAAAEAATLFFRDLDPSARFFTNRHLDPTSDRPLGYERVPCSESTFDSLVVAVGDRSAALLCVEDED